MEHDLDPHERALSSQARAERRHWLLSIGLAALAGVGIGLFAAGIYAIVTDDSSPQPGVGVDSPVIEVSAPPTPSTSPVLPSPGNSTTPATAPETADPMVSCLEEEMKDVDLPPGAERDEAFGSAQQYCISFLYGEG